MHPVVILAGGVGSRIKKISKDKPKILIKINRKPFIFYLLKYLESNGVKDVVICTGYGHSQIKNYVSMNKKKFKEIDIKISYEGKKRLGTAGAIRNAIKLIKENFIVIYGDNLFDFNFRKILNYKIKQNKLGLMVIKRNNSNYIESNVFKNKNRFYYEKKLNKYSSFYDYGILLFRKKVFSNLIRLRTYDLSNICEKLSKKNQIDFMITKKNLIEIGSLQAIKIFKNNINEFYKKIS